MTGQRKLKASSVLITGGLGSPLLLYLAAAGIGRIGVVDDDVVDLSNLQRQIIHGESMLGEYTDPQALVVDRCWMGTETHRVEKPVAFVGGSMLSETTDPLPMLAPAAERLCHASLWQASPRCCRPSSACWT